MLATVPGPLKKPKKRAVYAGSDRLWISANEGKAWKPISESFDGSIISALEIAPGDPRVIYVGTTNGGFFRTTNGGKNWSRNLAGPLGPGRLITRIATDPRNAQDVCYTIGMVAATSSLTTPFPAARPEFGAVRAASAVSLMEKRWFSSSRTFIDRRMVVTTGVPGIIGLPNLPAAAVIMLAGAAVILVAHDGGVVALQQDKVFDISGNVPNVRVTDLVLRAIPRKDNLIDGQLYISTYGRGVWSVGVEAVRQWLAQEMAGHH